MWRLFSEGGSQVWKFMKNEKPNSNIQNIPYDQYNQNSGDKIWRTIATEDFKPLSETAITKVIESKHTLQTADINIQAYDTPIIPIQCIDADITFKSKEILKSAEIATVKGIHYYQHLQMEDGHWPGDYGGPLFLLPGCIITMYVSGQQFESEQIKEMIKYLRNHQLKDGAWGLHIEQGSTMFGTVLSYISLRLLGVSANDKALITAREFIKKNGGAMYTPSWGKFWLCVLGVMDWSGVNSLVPELWLLPEVLPVHPWRWWCHCRMVYMPMSYIYGERVTGKLTDLVKELRTELYNEPYDSINWPAHRDSIAKVDLYTPTSLVCKALFKIVNAYERFSVPYFRRKADEFLLSYIHAEDEQTNYIDIGPVNKFLNMLSIYHAEGAQSINFQKHLARVNDYLWLSEDGLKCQGYNGSQLWDTAFSIQAIIESGYANSFHSCLTKAYSYLEISQVREDVKDRVKFYRHISKGGWPFSTRDHGWPITDCTSEGIKATLMIQNPIEQIVKQGVKQRELIDGTRLQDAVNVILSFQNTDGGWATYELTRAPGWLELINPAEVFAGIMIDYSYVECTSASIQALARFKREDNFPNHRRQEIDASIARGIDFVKKIQRPDGSWYGSWAVCFTYGAWFALEALSEVHECYDNSEYVRKGAQFLMSKQNADGGWGESYESCVKKIYVPHKKSQVINTAWAILALLKAKIPQFNVIHAAVKYLISNQESTGDWVQESISGVFNGNCMISYSNYRNIFPIWALARYANCINNAINQ